MSSGKNWTAKGPGSDEGIWSGGGFLDASSCARDVARLESLANQAANICRMRRSELFLSGTGSWPSPVGYGTRLKEWNELSHIAIRPERVR